MPIVFACPCGKQIRAKNGSSGRVFTCPACGQELEVPPVDAVDLGIDLSAPAPQPARPVAALADVATPALPVIVPCEFEYKMAQLPPNIPVREGSSHRGVAAAYLEEAVNRYAAGGWEFFRIDTIGIQEHPGCLSSLFGARAITINYYVATFRRKRT